MKVQSVHQIEITSRCNLRCRYCPHPKMGRAKIDMDADTYQQALNWASYFVKRGTQNELNLAGIGESTLHPDFVEYVRLARNAVGRNCKLVLATNGINMSEEIADCLQEYDVWTWVSLHRPEKAGPAVNMLNKRGVLKGVSADPSVSAIDWAGQVEWEVTANTEGQPCTWLFDGRVVVLSDGRISQCCLDAEGAGYMGNIMKDDPSELTVGQYSLCDKCHLTKPARAVHVA